MPISKLADGHPVILFDGECRFCNAMVNFIIDRDHDAVFRFAPLQSDFGKGLMDAAGLAGSGLDSLLLADETGVWVRSTAVLRIVRRLGLPWRLAYAAIVIPAALRDLGYRIVAKLRYRLFGKQDACRVPTSEIRARFVG